MNFVWLLLSISILFDFRCTRAQIEFVQLFDSAISSRESAAAVYRSTTVAATIGAPTNGSLQLSVESGTFRSAVYRISDAVLDRAAALANGWRLSAALTVQHSGASPDDATAPGDGFSFAYGEIPLAAEFFTLSDDQTNCGSSAPGRKTVAVCHMTYDMDIRPLGIHVLLSRTTDLIEPSLGEVLPALQRRRVMIVVEFRPSTNVTSVSSLGLSRQLVGNFTAPPVPLNAWMFGTRTGSRTELVQLEHVIVSTLGDQCKRATSGCDANSIVVPLGGEGGQLCATINTSLPLAADNVPVQIRYSGHVAWMPYSGEATISYAAVDSHGVIYALSIANARSVWTLERQDVCNFTVRIIDTVDSVKMVFSVSEGWIPSFVAGADIRSTLAMTLPDVSISTPTTSTTTATTILVSNANATTIVSLQSTVTDTSADLIGPIVGGVIGGIVLLIIIVGVYVISKRRKQSPPRATVSRPQPPSSGVIYTSLASAQPPTVLYERGDAHIYDSGQIAAFVE